LYNTLACFSVAVVVTVFSKQIELTAEKIKAKANHKNIITILIALSVIIFIIIAFDLFHLAIMMTLAWVLVALVAVSAAYYIPITEETYNTGLTIWDIQTLKILFKGGKINEREGKNVLVKWKLRDDDEDLVHFSKKDMQVMAADIGDLVYISDKRKWLGGLKSIHSRYGEPHDEDGVIYINKEHLGHALFVEDKILEAEKEM
jgi:SSS family solute:Na+ symporter